MSRSEHYSKVFERQMNYRAMGNPYNAFVKGLSERVGQALPDFRK